MWGWRTGNTIVSYIQICFDLRRIRCGVNWFLNLELDNQSNYLDSNKHASQCYFSLMYDLFHKKIFLVKHSFVPYMTHISSSRKCPSHMTHQTHVSFKRWIWWQQKAIPPYYVYIQTKKTIIPNPANSILPSWKKCHRCSFPELSTTTRRIKPKHCPTHPWRPTLLLCWVQ